MVNQYTLKNGIRLITKNMDGLFSISMGILVGTGGAFEDDAQDGISHFIEHMQFKGTPKRNALEISDAFDRIGAQVNAFTGKDLTCYYTKSTKDHTEEAFELLSDLFLNATYPEEEMVREKGVICEEISMNEDTPDDLCMDILSKAFYGKENYGRNILGSAKNVQGFTKENVNAYKKKRYSAKNIVLSFAGAVDFEQAKALAEKYFSNFSDSPIQEQEKNIQLQHQSLFKNKKIEQVHIALGFPSVSRLDDKIDATQIMNTIIGGGMSSRLFQQVREKMGLAYSVYSYTSNYNECGMMTVYAGVNPKNTQKAYKAIRDVIDNAKKEGFSDDEFLRGKEQMKSGALFSQESTPSQMLLYGKYMLFNNQVYDFEKKLSDLNAITKQQVLDTISLNFDESNMAIGVVGNIDKALEF